MHRDDLIRICDSQLMHVRNEFSYSQTTMAHALGISKKTLVDIEKGRRSLGWSGAVTLIALFPTSQSLAQAFNPNSPLTLVQALMLDGHETTGRVTHGGGWWAHVEGNEHYTIEQNVVSQHYRLVDADRRRIASSLSYEEIHTHYLNQIGTTSSPKE